MKVNWQLPIQTRDGRNARLLGTVRNGCGTHVVAIEDDNRIEEIHKYRSNGFLCSEVQPTNHDIINTPAPPVEVEIGERWVNVYRNDEGQIDCAYGIHPSKASAVNTGTTWPLPGTYLGPAKLPTKLTIEPQ